MISLQNKIIVVTGAGGLLGRAFITHCREAGAVAIATGPHVPHDPKAHSYVLDISSEDSVKSVVAEIVSKHGRIDGWINNAFPRTSDWGTRFEAIPYASLLKNLEMHLAGYFLCCQVALEQMKKQGKGSLINIGSIYGVVGPDFSVYDGTTMTSAGAYAPIKGGVVQLTRYLATYYGPHGVRVNTISPGGIEDKKQQAAAFIQNYSNRTPLGRMGRPDDIAPAAVFLLSDAAGYITGQNLLVDGGWTAK